MEAGAAAEEFITIVPVGEGKPAVKESDFVTVLSVGAAAGAAEVVVQRPRGARLGLGLKFEGGSAAAEKVRRLLVQSCAEDSPAANACAPWGKLIPGDEILAIDGVSVSDLTRIDCVRRLKDSDETLKLLVRHFDPNEKSKMDPVEELLTMSQNTDINMQITLPPPVPPRKLGKKNSFKDKQTLQTVGEQNALINIDGQKQSSNDKEGLITSQHVISNVTKLSRKSSFDSHIHRQNKEGITYFKKGSPDEVRRLVRRLSDGKVMPAEAEVYIDLLSNEWERCLVMADAESDDTGSSISTVVDRLGSMASSVENSIPSTPIMQPKTFDIQKVLNCIENIDSNILKDMTNGKFIEDEINLKKEFKKIENNTNGLTVSEKSLKNTQTKEDTKMQFKKEIQVNDKNNNYTIAPCNLPKGENAEPDKKEQTEVKQDVAAEKPKPMPRNTKVERSASEKKRKPIPLPETLPPPVPEPLLTPTKKTCIETWLQRSEAEMNNKIDDKYDENIAPEALPRLIDFVPKTQFKENSKEAPVCTRPTTAPPPPPVETREDGSGASLDTIGEMDESGDVTDSAKSVKKDETKTRKSSFERNFWEDRIHKSDAEDKSLSNDETPLPTCPRQPPDGVETPSDVVDKAPDLPTRLPPRLPPALYAGTTRPRLSYLSRTQDARSEASVKDKIAMFSNDLATSTDRLDKCGTLPVRTKSTLRNNTPSYSNSFSEVSTLDRRLTKSTDNLDDTPRSYKRHTDRPEVLGALEISNKEVKNSRFSHSELTKMPLFYGSTTTLPSSVDASFSRSVYHSRSVSDDTSNKNVSAHKLEHIIEQRKKSLSKLRGLVIPEVHSPIVDLPEIKVKDSISKPFILKYNQNDTYKKDNLTMTRSLSVNENKWNTNFLPNNIPKYSPAFKRKSLQVYSPSSLSKESTPERKLLERIDVQNKTYNKPSLAKTLRSTLESGSLLQSPIKDYKKSLGDIRDYKNVEIKICTTTEIVDSDNESALSSAQSSYRSSASSPMHHIDAIESDSSRLSPRISQYTSYSLVKSEIPSKSSNTEKSCEEFIKRKVCRSVSSDTNISLSSSAGSAATSGSQASCSSLESSVADSDKRKVSKVYNVDTINRRNILASAKCRSGRDINLKSPVVETKFSHESYNRSPSPTLKTSERLSTLTSSVSAITNKGETRRRNKVIAESDSDTDDDTHARNRKTEYKASRLKRNSSISNKSKQNENSYEPSKIEEGSKLIKEKIIQESTKTTSEHYGENKSNNLATHTQSVQRNNDIQKRKEIETLTSKKSIVNNIDVVDNVKPMLSYEKSDKIVNNKKEVSNNKFDSKYSDQPKTSTSIIRLKKAVGSGVGVILAGGTDCEAKDVTVHRVLSDSVAAKAGLKRGAKIKAINGCTMMGLTHAQSVTILKEQRSEVVIEIENENAANDSVTGCGSEKAESKDRQKRVEVSIKEDNSPSDVVTVIVEKAGGGTGLGFGLDGGRDSPHGDRPLTIKKLFAGGAAAQSGRILVGAELLSAGGQSMETFTRTQAWAALKSLPAGPVALVLRNPKGTKA
ncbi:PREDICTED: uncharacterized protein LOC106100586 [Papilio polytes]|uniref:uncharacterized protein LOC106100586 n=1 Tax=Papilio polytes TaxID=76194 RepID=UPI0006762465|nr:PREDICTED: uncharacterized protein LOC106100586 [Papilio polytes]